MHMSPDWIEIPKQNDTPFRIWMVDITAYLVSHKLQQIYTTAINSNDLLLICEKYTNVTVEKSIMLSNISEEKG